MSKITKYTQAQEEQAVIKMYQSGLTAGDKSKIIKARKLPKNTMDNFEVFKTFFLSGEGVPSLIKSLSEKEIKLLHILAFNQWITDVAVFEAAYVDIPKRQKYYYERGTFTQRYGKVLKAVQTNLVQKGLLIKYENPRGGDSKAERQRFLFPTAFAAYLPSPFAAIKKLEGKGLLSNENIRKEIKRALQVSPKSTNNGIQFTSHKLYIKKALLSEESIAQAKLRQWQLSDSALILYSKYFDKGKTLTDFMFFHLKKLAPNQWLSEKSITELLTTWDYPKKRRELDIDITYQKRYELKGFWEAGWKAGLLEKQTQAGVSYYRLVSEQGETTDFEKFLQLKEDGIVRFDLTMIPLPTLTILNQIAFLQKSTSTSISAKPDVVHLSNLPASVWEHPLIHWLKEKSPAFSTAFADFKKKYGKEIIHENLMVAKITDLSLRVLVEKALQKNQQIMVLSDEFIAFPKGALATVQRIVSKSGNVIKWVEN